MLHAPHVPTVDHCRHDAQQDNWRDANWNAVCWYQFGSGAVVKKRVAQYAVIEARRTDGPAERFVVAYADERTLRELIAGRNIIACGFVARDDAQVHINANICASRGDARQQDLLKSSLSYFGLARRAAQKAFESLRFHANRKLLPALLRRVTAVALFATHS